MGLKNNFVQGKKHSKYSMKDANFRCELKRHKQKKLLMFNLHPISAEHQQSCVTGDGVIFVNYLIGNANFNSVLHHLYFFVSGQNGSEDVVE